MILAENNHLLINPSYRNRFSAKQASNPSVALKQENRGITHVERQEFKAVCLWGISPTSHYDPNNPRIEQLLLPRYEATLQCGARDQSRTKRGVKHGQHGHGVGHQPLPQSRHVQASVGKGVYNVQGENPHAESQEDTAVTGKREDNSAIVSRCKHRSICCSAKLLMLHGA